MFRVHFQQVRRWLVDGCRVESPSLCRLKDHQPTTGEKKQDWLRPCCELTLSRSKVHQHTTGEIKKRIQGLPRVVGIIEK